MSRLSKRKSAIAFSLGSASLGISLCLMAVTLPLTKKVVYQQTLPGLFSESSVREKVFIVQENDRLAPTGLVIEDARVIAVVNESYEYVKICFILLGIICLFCFKLNSNNLMTLESAYEEISKLKQKLAIDLGTARFKQSFAIKQTTIQAQHDAEITALLDSIDGTYADINEEIEAGKLSNDRAIAELLKDNYSLDYAIKAVHAGINKNDNPDEYNHLVNKYSYLVQDTHGHELDDTWA